MLFCNLLDGYSHLIPTHDHAFYTQISILGLRRGFCNTHAPRECYSVTPCLRRLVVNHLPNIKFYMYLRIVYQLFAFYRYTLPLF